MKRREFITLLGSAAATWPLAVRAQQQPAVPVIGFLNAGSAAGREHLVAAFRQGLKDAGFVEGQNVAIEYHWAEGQHDRLPALANDFIQRHVSIIIATGGPTSILAAKSATTTTPIVFTTGSDPVKLGFVASLNRPGGNVTGVHMFLTGLEAKKLGLLHDLVPQAAVMTALVNPTSTDAATQTRDIQEAARTIGRQVEVLTASNDNDLDTAFARIVRTRAGALLVGANPFFLTRRDPIIAWAARQAIPAIYELREFPLAGGLMSYGTSLGDAYRQVGIYAGKILKGDKPADMPVFQPTKFEFVINLRTAKALGLTIPSGVLAIADEVIE